MRKLPVPTVVALLIATYGMQAQAPAEVAGQTAPPPADQNTPAPAQQLLQQAAQAEDLKVAALRYEEARKAALAENPPDRQVESAAILGLLEVLDTSLASTAPVTDSQGTAEKLGQATSLLTEIRPIARADQIQAAINLAGLIHSRVKEYEQSLRIFETLDMGRTEPSERFVYYYNRGSVYEFNHRLPEAFHDYLESLRLNPVYRNARSAAEGIVGPAGYGADGDARICTAIAKGKGVEGAGECLETAAKKWAGRQGSVEILATRIMLDPTFTASSIASAGNDPALNQLWEFARAPGSPLVQDGIPQQLSLWKPEPHALSTALVGSAGQFIPYDRQKLEQNQIGQLLAIYLTAWFANPANATAGRRAAELLRNDWQPKTVQDWESLVSGIAKHTLDPSKFQHDEEASVELFDFHMSLGEMLKLFNKCTLVTEDLTNPLTQWLYAIKAEVPRAAKSIEVRRNLADCYSQLSEHVEATRYEEEINKILMDRYSARLCDGCAPGTRTRTGLASVLGWANPALPEPLVRHHLYATLYGGSWIKSGAQAGIQMLMDSPHDWSHGLSGFGEHLTSSQATRAVRQMLALALDYQSAQDPLYVPSGEHAWTRRLRHAAKQTFLSKNDRLQWKPALWRFGSAFGSEGISQSWRPTGTGLGDRNSWSWAERGMYVLVGDTVSNIFREFLPRHGKWGTLFRPLL